MVRGGRGTGKLGHEGGSRRNSLSAKDHAGGGRNESRDVFMLNKTVS